MPAARQLALDGPFDLVGTLSAACLGRFDPTCRLEGGRFYLATYVGGEPASIAVTAQAGVVDAEAHGPGADALLDLLPDLCGAFDDPLAFAPSDRRVAAPARRNPGLKMSKHPSAFHALVPIILQQRVMWRDACRSYRALVTRFGEEAPGPFSLMLPPTPKVLVGLPSYELRAIGVEAKRAQTIVRCARSARRVEETKAMTFADATRRLEAFSGVGPWTSQLLLAQALGDADAVPTGDVGLPHFVAQALAGERYGTDERMLELLEPFRPHRWRAIRLLARRGGRTPETIR